jgi:hypothetical protein
LAGDRTLQGVRFQFWSCFYPPPASDQQSDPPTCAYRHRGTECARRSRMNGKALGRQTNCIGPASTA